MGEKIYDDSDKKEELLYVLRCFGTEGTAGVGVEWSIGAGIAQEEPILRNLKITIKSFKKFHNM